MRSNAAPTAPSVPEDAPGADGWRVLFLVGGVVAFVALAGMLFDIVLTMVPGWGSETVPTAAAAWLAQMVANPLLGMRNLDFLNICISTLSIPLYLAVFGAHRRSEAGLAGLGLLLVTAGTVLFIANNAALPLLELARQYGPAATDAQRAGLEAAAGALLASGSHGSFGAFPGFFVSELGTLVITIAMLRGRVFSRTASLAGLTGVAILMVYTTAYTFASGGDALIMTIAIPGGLLMIAWHALVGRALLRMAAIRS